MGHEAMLTVMATLRAHPAQAEALMAVLDTLAAASRAEHGCAAYRVFRSRQDPAQFSTFEQWASSGAEAQHMVSAHVAAAFKQAAPLLAAAPEIRHFDEV